MQTAVLQQSHRASDSAQRTEGFDPNRSDLGITVVIPCLDEEDAIGRVIDAARSGISKLGLAAEILVVDNGCTDQTAAVAQAHGALVLAQPKPGYGAALRLGLDHASYEILVMGDGDLSYDFSALDVLVAPLLGQEADVVIGNRLRNLEPGSMPRSHRYVGNPLLSTMLRLLFKTRVRDAQCGMRAITKTAYSQLRCVTTGMEFASEMIIKAIDRNLRIAERDIVYSPRLGSSKLHPFKDGWRHLRFMFLHSPTRLVLVPGLICWGLGIAFSVRLALGPINVNGRLIDFHCMMMAGLLDILSVQAITTGLLAKAYAHLSGLKHDRIVSWLYRHLTFGKALLITTPLALIGLTITLAIIDKWIVSGFGNLNEGRLLFLALVLLVNGVQLATASYLFSIMVLPRSADLPEAVS